MPPEPFGASTPVTVNGTVPMRRLRPTGSESWKSSVATVFPMIADLLRERRSSSVKKEPEAIPRFLMAS